MRDLEIASTDHLWSWLATHYAQPDSVRLITSKAAHPDKYLSRDEVLDDLAGTLDLLQWNALAPSYRRNVLRWIKLAKTAPTRAKRIAAAAQATTKEEKLPQM